jgi:hypothetical protein
MAIKRFIDHKVALLLSGLIAMAAIRSYQHMFDQAWDWTDGK